MGIPKHKLAVAVMILNNDKILLVRGTRGWEFPGGYVEEGESIRAAAVREVKEECGIDIKLSTFCGIEQEVSKSTCVALFAGIPTRNNRSVRGKSLPARYFTVDEAMRKITRSAFKDRIGRCVNKAKQPFVMEI